LCPNFYTQSIKKESCHVVEGPMRVSQVVSKITLTLPDPQAKKFTPDSVSEAPSHPSPPPADRRTTGVSSPAPKFTPTGPPIVVATSISTRTAPPVIIPARISQKQISEQTQNTTITASFAPTEDKMTINLASPTYEIPLFGMGKFRKDLEKSNFDFCKACGGVPGYHSKYYGGLRAPFDLTVFSQCTVKLYSLKHLNPLKSYRIATIYPVLTYSPSSLFSFVDDLLDGFLVYNFTPDDYDYAKEKLSKQCNKMLPGATIDVMTYSAYRWNDQYNFSGAWSQKPDNESNNKIEFTDIDGPSILSFGVCRIEEEKIVDTPLYGRPEYRIFGLSTDQEEVKVIPIQLSGIKTGWFFTNKDREAITIRLKKECQKRFNNPSAYISDRPPEIRHLHAGASAFTFCFNGLSKEDSSAKNSAPTEEKMTNNLDSTTVKIPLTEEIEEEPVLKLTPDITIGTNKPTLETNKQGNQPATPEDQEDKNNITFTAVTSTEQLSINDRMIINLTTKGPQGLLEAGFRGSQHLKQKPLDLKESLRELCESTPYHGTLGRHFIKDMGGPESSEVARYFGQCTVSASLNLELDTSEGYQIAAIYPVTDYKPSFFQDLYDDWFTQWEDLGWIAGLIFYDFKPTDYESAKEKLSEQCKKMLPGGTINDMTFYAQQWNDRYNLSGEWDHKLDDKSGNLFEFTEIDGPSILSIGVCGIPEKMEYTYVKIVGKDVGWFIQDDDRDYMKKLAETECKKQLGANATISDENIYGTVISGLAILAKCYLGN